MSQRKGISANTSYTLTVTLNLKNGIVYHWDIILPFGDRNRGLGENLFINYIIRKSFYLESQSDGIRIFSITQKVYGYSAHKQVLSQIAFVSFQWNLRTTPLWASVSI